MGENSCSDGVFEQPENAVRIMLMCYVVLLMMCKSIHAADTCAGNTNGDLGKTDMICKHQFGDLLMICKLQPM